MKIMLHSFQRSRWGKNQMIHRGGRLYFRNRESEIETVGMKRGEDSFIHMGKINAMVKQIIIQNFVWSKMKRKDMRIFLGVTPLNRAGKIVSSRCKCAVTKLSARQDSVLGRLDRSDPGGGTTH